MISILTQRALKLAAIQFVRQRKARLGDRLPEPTLLYFAYGANLDAKRFSKYDMNVLPVGTAKLEDHALRFSLPCEYLDKGFASTEPEAGHAVWGVVYKFDKPSMFLLDVMEWALLNQYRRVLVNVKLSDGQVLKAFCYRARYPRSGLMPSTQYKSMVLESARAHGFPKEYLSEIENQPSKDKFDLDPGFSLLMPHVRRPFERLLRKPYLWHDQIREIVCEKLRF